MRKILWPIDKQSVFLKRLGVLLQNGYSMQSALEFLKLQENNLYFESIDRCIINLSNGESIHQTFTNLRFHPEVLGYIFYAERHGDIPSTFMKAGNLLERKSSQQQQLVKILKYPMFLIFISGVLLSFFYSILLPRFKSIFQSSETEESIFLQFIFQLFSILPYAVYLMIGTIIFLTIFYFCLYKKLSPLMQMQLKLKIPYLNIIFRMLNTFYFSNQLGMLLVSGLSISEAFLLMSNQNDNLFFKFEAERIHKNLLQGNELNQIVQEKKYYNLQLNFIISHGLQNGLLGRELSNYSDYVLEKIDETIQKGLSVIQPIVYCGIAIVIILIYSAMLLPMLNMFSEL